MLDRRRIHLSAPDIRTPERQQLLAALDAGWAAPAGPDLERFERAIADRAGVGHAVALSSGTAALHLVLVAMGIGAGDDVIVSTSTFAATANSVVHAGARPVFVDAEPGSWNLDPDLLEEELAERAARGTLPAAVVCVDLYGQPADYRRIVPICDRFEVPLVEDAAEALGSSLDGRPAGSFGRAAVFSFNGNKLITCSGGGMVVSDDAALVDRIRFLSTQAREPVRHYEHREIGWNARLSNLLAAFGCGQLATLDERIATRRALFDRYLAAFAGRDGIVGQPEIPGGWCTRWLSCATIDPERAGFSAAELIDHLEAEDIEARPAWKPMHAQPVFAGAPARITGVADRLFATGVCLPSGSGMSDEDHERIFSSLDRLLGAAGTR